MRTKEVELLESIIVTMDKNDPDTIVLQLAKTVLEEGLDSEYDTDVVNEACEIIKKRTKKAQVVEQPFQPQQFNIPTRIVHEHRFPMQNNLTSWVMWLIIPLVAAFLFVSGVLLM